MSRAFKQSAFFLVLEVLFLGGAIINLVKGDYLEMSGGLVIAAFFGIVHTARREKDARDTAALETLLGGETGETNRLHCCRCGSDARVSPRAYVVTYSLLLYTSMSPGAIRPICHRCRFRAGLPYSLFTLVAGWWGFPWGPILTVRALYRNFRGGVVLTENRPEVVVAAPPPPSSASEPAADKKSPETPKFDY